MADYIKTNWQDGVTPLSASNMNKIEGAIETMDSKVKSNYKVFTANGSFVVPAGVTKIKVTGCAAGGDGGITAGGNAGQYLLDAVYNVTPGQSLTIVCGTGNSTITELGITLLANSLTTNFSNNKLGNFVNNADNAAPSTGDGKNAIDYVPAACRYKGLFENYVNPNGGTGSTGKKGGKGSPVGGGSGVSISSGYLGGKGGLIGESGSPGATYYGKGTGGVGGAFGGGGGGAAGDSRGYGAGGGAGGFGAGGGGGDSATTGSGGKGSPGFILIEW